MLRDIRQYLIALARHWMALVVTGGAITLALGVMPAVLGESVAPWVWRVVLVIGVLPASFLAWRDERRTSSSTRIIT